MTAETHGSVFASNVSDTKKYGISAEKAAYPESSTSADNFASRQQRKGPLVWPQLCSETRYEVDSGL